MESKRVGALLDGAGVQAERRSAGSFDDVEILPDIEIAEAHKTEDDIRYAFTVASEKLTLNRKQAMVLKLIANAMIDRLLRSENDSGDTVHRTLLLYLGGEGGTRKSGLIEALRVMLEILSIQSWYKLHLLVLCTYFA